MSTRMKRKLVGVLLLGTTGVGWAQSGRTWDAKLQVSPQSTTRVHIVARSSAIVILDETGRRLYSIPPATVTRIVHGATRPDLLAQARKGAGAVPPNPATGVADPVAFGGAAVGAAIITAIRQQPHSLGLVWQEDDTSRSIIVSADKKASAGLLADLEKVCGRKSVDVENVAKPEQPR